MPTITHPLGELTIALRAVAPGWTVYATDAPGAIMFLDDGAHFEGRRSTGIITHLEWFPDILERLTTMRNGSNPAARPGQSPRIEAPIC